MHIPTFNLVVALPAEAKPLIRHFHLKRQQPDGDFPIYQNDQITLVLSGVGKQASAAATRFLAENRNITANTIWINIGIAGHATRPVGDMILAQNVIDEATRQQWETQPDFKTPCDLEQLTTLEHPSFDYAHPGAFDMEAAGFLAAAGEKAYCLKIISDNRDNPGQGIRGKVVSQLIREKLALLGQLMEEFKL